MKAYSVSYTTKGSSNIVSVMVDASSVKCAKSKIERKIKNKIRIKNIKVIGYY